MDRQARQVLDEIAGEAGAPPDDLLAWTRQHRATIDSLSRFAMPPEPVTVVSNVTGPVPLRVYRPAVEGLLPVFIYFHGGGGMAGSIETYDSPLRAIANRSGWAIVYVDYRLAPEHPFPAPLEDCIAALRHVAAGRIPGLDTWCMAIGGDGIGGTFATTAARETGAGLRCQILLYPHADFRADADYPSRRTEEGRATGRNSLALERETFAPDASSRANPRLSPILAVDLAHLPPAHIITCEHDPLRDEAEAYAARLREAGVHVTHTRYPGMIHGFLQMGARIDATARLIEEVASALRTA